ncbi:zinc metalloprotease HtpX [Aquihabitans sp. G128]|uniref:zinc metalloprotease HtpX n=1 Tax=Aquihabitans sp. G128 TaxID=2849779 RepID=UPI001C23F7B5|nr:zinc metalloprotease HtpX [Aquihabitans sp. G128]QXC60228.1 zinc metalloprotease HtpX [Aquihabitans sp. G128]
MMNNLKTAVILATIGGLMIVVGGAIGGTGGAAIGMGIGLVFVGGSYWFSDKLAIKSAKAVEVSEAQMPRYHAIVADLCQRADMPMPRLYVSPDPQPNAFATGRSPNHAAVCVNQGILDILSWEELQGVLAHEISHVRNRDILISSVAASVAMGITFLARMAMWGAMFGGGGRDRNDNVLGTLALAILAPVAATFLQMALSRNREYEADRRGAKLLGTGEPLARALEKLDRGVRQVAPSVNPAQATAYIANPFSGQRGQLARFTASHPPMEDRIARLRSGEWQH